MEGVPFHVMAALLDRYDANGDGSVSLTGNTLKSFRLLPPQYCGTPLLSIPMITKFLL
jgi:hypothetical protein